jgi:hypothetical protein
MKFQPCWLRVLTKIELSIKSITKIKLLIESITKIKLLIDISNGLLLKSAPDPLPKIENAMERALTNWWFSTQETAQGDSLAIVGWLAKHYIREEKLLQSFLWKMVHFALFLVKISINFWPGYSTLFFSPSQCTSLLYKNFKTLVQSFNE